MRTFLGFGQVAYIGIPSTQPIKLGGISARIIPLLFQWISYGASTARPNINIAVDFDNASCKAFDQVRSVYIDNLGSDNPVYVNFPDTNYTIVAAPNSEGWYPAFTNSRKLWVIGEGFLTGDIPQTFILLSNIPLPPAVNVEINQAISLFRASPVITRGTSIYNSAFGVPALGDQIQSSDQLVLSVGNTVPLWGTPYPSGFLIITGMSLNLSGIGLAIPGNCKIVIESTGIAGVLCSPIFWANSVPDNGVDNIPLALGLQTKLDATQTWRMRSVSSLSGFGQLISSFTQQP